MINPIEAKRYAEAAMKAFKNSSGLRYGIDYAINEKKPNTIELSEVNDEVSSELKHAFPNGVGNIPSESDSDMFGRREEFMHIHRWFKPKKPIENKYNKDIETKTAGLFHCNPDESILSTHIEESILIVTTTKRVVAIEVPE